MAAKKKNRNLLEDPRYADFVERYHADPLRFAVEVTGFVPSADQESLFEAITPESAKVSVVSGTGTGKTAAFARIALWHLLCFPVAVYEGKVEVGSNTYIGAPFIQQVADGIWKEMQDTRIAIANGPHAWLNDFFTITKTRVHVNGFAEQWFITQIAMKKGEAIGVAGKHRYWQLIIIDEAAGVPDDHFNVIDGTQTQGGNRTLMASQGARNAGRFYDSHHTLNRKNGGSWHALRFNSELSPFVTTQWLRERANESGGRNSVEYQIRVLGLFAQSSSNVLLTRADIEAAFVSRKLIADDEPFGLVVLSDVALGEYTNSRGVVDIHMDETIRPPMVQPFERGSRTVGFAVYTGERGFERLDVSQMARLKMPRVQWVPQYGVVEKAVRLAIAEDDIDSLPIMPSMVGGSLLYSAEGPYDNLTASLLGLVGQRWMDSIDEQMVAVNLESMNLDQQQRFVESVKAMLMASKAYAEQAVKTGRPVMERIRHIIPVFNEKQLSTVGPANGGAPGRAATISIEDVMLHARMLAGALGVDLSMLGFADQLSGGLGEGGFFRVSAQAAERARIIRVALSDFFNHVIDIHTMRRYGVVFDPKERPWTINFFGSISALEAEKQRTRSDSMNAGMLLAQSMQMMKELGASKEVMTEFLVKTMMLDEDQAKLYASVVDAKPPEDDGGMGGGFGGMRG